MSSENCWWYFLDLVTLMDALSSELTPARPVVPTNMVSTGLLLCQDVIFTTKITRTAADLGYPMMVASMLSQACSMIKTWQPRVVLVDLNASDVAAPSALTAYRELAGADVWFVAFGPHVEVDKLTAAKAAGCHVVMPRSKFAAQLPELMQQYFTQPAPCDS